MEKNKEARKAIAESLHLEYNFFNSVLYNSYSKEAYTRFTIPKKNGGEREVFAPNPQLKFVQRRLAEKLSAIYREENSYEHSFESVSHGFEKKCNILTNSRIHKGKRYILNLDISNFFDSFNFGRVRGFFVKNKYFKFNEEQATIIAQLTCYNGKLPQGAPTSPLVANLIFNIVDMRIIKLAKKYRLNYTRYADDLSFSTNNKKFGSDYTKFINQIESLLDENGFKINNSKTRLQEHHRRQEVTGVTVNDKLNAKKTYIKDTRAMANSLYCNGEYFLDNKNKKSDLLTLESRFSFINQIDCYNNKIEHELSGAKCENKYKSRLNKREKQFQTFLFYKHFYNPSKVTLVTEGSTDILHIKAALKKHYKQYPNLIKKNGTKYIYEIKFLKRTKRLRYFFGIVEDGANTMINIWNHYKGDHQCTNIHEVLNRKFRFHQGDVKRKPVILIFDNEQKCSKSSTKRPLKEFLKSTKIEMDINELTKHLCSNLYLQTIPLHKGMDECEIEDLYKEDVLKIKKDGKTFSKKSEEDTNLYFGKKIFAKHIYNNYKKIDFSNFLPLLDCIDKIITDNNNDC